MNTCQMEHEANDGRSAANKGRGAGVNPPNRFEPIILEPDPEWDPAKDGPLRTEFFRDSASSLITYNDSPDVPFSASLNIYRGCEHGCSYCFARPSHEYLGLSSGVDFESRVFVKEDAPRLLRDELSSRRWTPQVVVMSGVTDCYQPAERRFRLTRACLEIFTEFRNPVSIITKSRLVARDLDLLTQLHRFDGIRVFVSVTTLDSELARQMEPRASSPQDRLRVIRELSSAGIPVGVMAAPMIPGLTDHELPSILESAKEAGAVYAGYVLLRLPFAVKDVFTDWLDQHHPGKKERVLSRLRDMRGGKLYDSTWGKRMHGEGIFAEQLSRVFDVTSRRLNFSGSRTPLSTEHFRPAGGTQLNLF